MALAGIDMAFVGHAGAQSQYIPGTTACASEKPLRAYGSGGI